jgi:hypothetical protein
MLTFIIVTAFLAPSVLIVSACMLSSRLSQEEEFVEHYDNYNSEQPAELISASSHS